MLSVRSERFDMAEIEEELSTPISSQHLSFAGSPGKGKLTILLPNVTNDEAATIAWLANHAKGTEIKLELTLI